MTSYQVTLIAKKLDQFTQSSYEIVIQRASNYGTNEMMHHLIAKRRVAESLRVVEMRKCLTCLSIRLNKIHIKEFPHRIGKLLCNPLQNACNIYVIHYGKHSYAYINDTY